MTPLFQRLINQAIAALAVIAVIGIPNSASAQGIEITSAPGYEVTWDGNDGDFFDPAPPPAGAVAPDNVALAANGATPFASSVSLHFPPHQIANLNDGFYGNANSHINGQGLDPGTLGIALPAMVELTAIAWGRDNGNGAFDDSAPGTDCCGGQVDDRCLGIYTLQITTVAAPDDTTPDGDWTTIATLDYQTAVDTIPGDGFTPWFRHQYVVSTDIGDPISATGVRILAPDLGTAIDEIELYSPGEVPVPVLSPVEEAGEIDPSNLAASETAFAKDVLAGRQIASLNDQVFGDASAWVGDTADSFAGIRLDGLQTVRSVAFGRDNTGAQTDRALGGYTLQYTAVADPDEATPDADWKTIGTIEYVVGDPAEPHLRHRFNFGTVMATGIRLLTPDGAAIDEIEAYEAFYVPPPPPALTITAADGFSATWDGNDGDFFGPLAPPEGAVAPDNLALATNGSTAFASSPVSLHFPPHQVANLNDGFYGNANSHINGQGTAPGTMGIALPGITAITAIAWGRDNGNGAFDGSEPGSDCCGGQLRDRSVGIYTLQFTAAASPDELTPDEEWTTIAEFNYTGAAGTDDEPGGLFTEYFRHQYQIGVAGGGSIAATGVRLIAPDLGTCIDEIEIYGSVSTAPFEITAFAYDAATGDATITFNSQPGAFYALEGSTDLQNWTELDDGIEGMGTSTTIMNAGTAPGTPRRYFRVRKF